MISKKKGIHNIYILTPYPSRPGRTEGARHGLKKLSVFSFNVVFCFVCLYMGLSKEIRLTDHPDTTAQVGD